MHVRLRHLLGHALMAAWPSVRVQAEHLRPWLYVGAGHWLAGHGAIVLDPVDAALREVFTSGVPPRTDCSIPESLELDGVGRLQASVAETARTDRVDVDFEDGVVVRLLAGIQRGPPF